MGLLGYLHRVVDKLEALNRVGDVGSDGCNHAGNLVTDLSLLLLGTDRDRDECLQRALREVAMIQHPPAHRAG